MRAAFGDCGWCRGEGRGFKNLAKMRRIYFKWLIYIGLDMKQPILASSARPEEFSSLNPSRFPNQKRPAAFFRDIAFDFANTFKAFIGANYLAAPFAFSKAGWVLGTLILSTIAALSFHCCVLIIGCKRAAIERINARTGEDRMSIASRLQFPDIGREAFGQTGYVVVSAALGLSQAGFCVGYLIFMGITLKVFSPSLTPFHSLRRGRY